MIQKIGKYPIRKYLGSLGFEGKLLSASKHAHSRSTYDKVLDLGVIDVVSLREILKIDSDFKIEPEITLSLDKNFEFYRVTLVTDFYSNRHTKFIMGKISVSLESSPFEWLPQIYSISPMDVNDALLSERS